jgi:type VI secretion system secreted protein Hcp
MTIEGTEHGKIEGECPMKGREGTVEVQQFDHEVSMPHDNNNGLPTGNAVHKAMVVCKEFDKTSPKLYFTYRKLTWNFEPAGIGAEAEWREPPTA